MNKYEEIIYSLIYNSKKELTVEETEILNQASAIYNTYNNLTKKLGCPLGVVFKALKDGIFCENERGYAINLRVHLQFVEANAKYNLLDFNYDFILPLEDYKKTWWLKEDRSE